MQPGERVAELAGALTLATDLGAGVPPESALRTALLAAAIARAARLPGAGDGVLAALGDIYERWDGRGQPHGRRGQAIGLPSRVLHLANALEVHLRVGGTGAALAMASERRGRHFDPALADLVLAQGPALLEPCQEPSVWDAFLAAEPAPHRSLPAEGRRALAVAFAEYVDLKSPYTLGHSV